MSICIYVNLYLCQFVVNSWKTNNNAHRHRNREFYDVKCLRGSRRSLKARRITRSTGILRSCLRPVGNEPRVRKTHRDSARKSRMERISLRRILFRYIVYRIFRYLFPIFILYKLLFLLFIYL